MHFYHYDKFNINTDKKNPLPLPYKFFLIVARRDANLSDELPFDEPSTKRDSPSLTFYTPS